MAGKICASRPERRAENNGCCAVGCLLAAGGKLYAVAGGVCVLLTHTQLPLGLVRPMACMAAAVGDSSIRQQFWHVSAGKSCFCAGGPAVFYAACLLGASLLAGGEVNWQGSNVMRR